MLLFIAIANESVFWQMIFAFLIQKYFASLNKTRSRRYETQRAYKWDRALLVGWALGLFISQACECKPCYVRQK